LVENGDALQEELRKSWNIWTVPNIFLNKQHISGYEQLNQLYEKGELEALIAFEKAEEDSGHATAPLTTQLRREHQQGQSQTSEQVQGHTGQSQAKESDKVQSYKTQVQSNK
jgi:hypothetical protein